MFNKHSISLVLLNAGLFIISVSSSSLSKEYYFDNSLNDNDLKILDDFKEYASGNDLENTASCDEECDGNPDQYLNTVQIIKRYGYPAESHIVETEDGYLLTLHRIPGTKDGQRGGQPVYLQHGLLSSSTDWVDEGNKSLAFMLADKGYDVWMGNARGNTYSKAHVSLNPWSAKFWNFSWHEVGYYDLPASLYYVSNTTDKPGNIIYIGHSMGTTTFFVFSSTRPSDAKNVRIMVALAPVAYMTHIKSPIRYLAPFANDFQWLTKFLGINQFLPSNKLLDFLAYDCQLLKIDEKICRDIIFTLCGFDEREFNMDILPVVLAHDPAGTSTKTIIHYAQEIRNEGWFQYFDYGRAGNMIEYGQPTPPKYNLKNIKVPIYMMYAENDWLASPIDVARLAQILTNVAGLYKVPLEVFNHVDFLFGKDAASLVYQPLIKFIKNYNETEFEDNEVY